MLRIAKYPWHTGHDYELAKLPHSFFYLLNTPRVWATQYRPIPANVQWVPHLQAASADVMILHLDQWSFDEPSKRFLYLRFRDSFDGPKIVIIHGTRTSDGCSEKQMQELVGSCYAVCNSTTALASWSLPNGRCVIHGMSPEEWPSTNYERNNIVLTQPANARHLATRNQKGIERALQSVALDWIGGSVKPRSFREYQEFLATSSVFFNPSFASCNPRARTEAMLCGLAVVTTNSHGEDQYIDNGVNGFCSNDIDELIDYLRFLQAHPEEAQRLGQAGQATARKVFHIDRFVSDWEDVLHEVVPRAILGARS